MWFGRKTKCFLVSFSMVVFSNSVLGWAWPQVANAPNHCPFGGNARARAAVAAAAKPTVYPLPLQQSAEIRSPPTAPRKRRSATKNQRAEGGRRATDHRRRLCRRKHSPPEVEEPRGRAAAQAPHRTPSGRRQPKEPKQREGKEQGGQEGDPHPEHPIQPPERQRRRGEGKPKEGRAPTGQGRPRSKRRGRTQPTRGKADGRRRGGMPAAATGRADADRGAAEPEQNAQGEDPP